MFKKFNKLEKSWIFYDIGNSAFTMMVSTIIPIWFNTLADTGGLSETDYLANWSFATSIATVCTAIMGPVFGAISDNRGYKKPMFTFFLLVGAAGCALLGIVPSWSFYLVTYIIAKVSYQTTLVLYDSMLTDITTPERMDLVSAQGYAWGYLGSCIPFLAALVLYFLGTINVIPVKLAIVLDFLIVAAWWICVSLPLLKGYKQNHYVETTGSAIIESFKRLGNTLVHLFKKEKKVFWFLLAFFFYIDGVYTIIDEAVAIGTSLGLDQMGLLVVLLLTQVVAFAFATLFGKLSEKYSSLTLISVCIFGYFVVAIYALFMKTLWQFGIMAFIVGMFQGAIQALSRSYYAQIIPADTSGEYFGLYDICGKGAAFMGTTLVGVTVSITNSVNIAVGTLGILFVLGYLFLRKSSSLSSNH